jgi:hypothetical protein
MPSFALRMLLLTYLSRSTLRQHSEAHPFMRLLEQVLNEDLVLYDRYFTEADAAYVAAGVYFFGLKQDTPAATVIPAPVWRAWESSSELRQRIPDPLDVGRVENLLRWARLEGSSVPEVAEYLAAIQPFQKHGPGRPRDREAVRRLAAVEPRFGILYDYPHDAPPQSGQLRGGPRTRLKASLWWLANQLRRFANRLVWLANRLS